MHFVRKFAILFSMSKKSPSSPFPSRARRARVPSPLRRRRRRGVPGTFGDLCEISEGLAVVWRRKGCTDREMWAFANDDPAILCDVVPALHALGFSEDDVIRSVPHSYTSAFLLLCLSRFMTARGLRGRGSGAFALPPLLAVSFVRRALSRAVAALQNRAARPAHYEAERARRRAMAAERRRVRRRSTSSPCPTKEELAEAWGRVRDSKEALVRFGSMVQDLECYVDNSLRMDEAGRIVGRNAGVKGWLRENLPELAEHYSSVMRYKAAAKKLRQVVGLADPTPVAAVLAGGGGARRAEGAACDCGAEKSSGGDGCNAEAELGGEVGGDMDGVGTRGTSRRGAGAADGTPPLEVVRARAVYLEAMEGVPDVAAKVLARIDALCDPEHLDEAATLRSWRERYEREITARRKKSWWRRLTA